jgi:hypothetical protein
MEPQRRELLAQCQQSLAQAMTEVEAVLGLLEAAGALSPGERRQLDEEAGGAKAERLLKLLLAKERDHSQDLRLALEKTQPHLLPILYLNGVVGPPQPAEGAGEWQTPAAASPQFAQGDLARATTLPWRWPAGGIVSAFSSSGEGVMPGLRTNTSSPSPAGRCEQSYPLPPVKALPFQVPWLQGPPGATRSCLGVGAGGHL